jgi:hypothetical protein
MYFAAQYPARTFPCQRFAGRSYLRRRMTRGRCGSLFLQRFGLSPICTAPVLTGARRSHVQTEGTANVRPDPSEPYEQSPGKLADAEVVFEADAGPLNGLKLIGFAVWERRAGRRNVALLDYVWTTVAGDCCTPRSCCETCSMISFSWKGDRPSDAKGGRIVPQSGHSVETGRSSRAGHCHSRSREHCEALPPSTCRSCRTRRHPPWRAAPDTARP